MKKILSVAAAVALTSTLAFSADQTVGVESDSVGNYLVTPAIYATTGYETRLSVINPSSTNAVVAKVVIREGKCSKEVRDFLLFLSPGDKWDGTITANGEASQVTSLDDSTRKTFTEQLPGMTYGYVEVFALAEYNATALDSTFSVGSPLAKSKITAAYDGNTAGISPINTDAITGTVSLVNSTSHLGMTVPMTAVGITTLAGNVFDREAENTSYDTDFGAQSDDAYKELMTAMAKTNVYVPYTNGNASILNLVFLDKSAYYTCGKDLVYTTTIRDNEEHTVKSDDIFSGTTKPTYSVSNEVSQIVIDGTSSSTLDLNSITYTAGWIDYQLPTYPATFTAIVGTASAPVIPSLMDVISAGGENVTNMYYPAFAGITPNN